MKIYSESETMNTHVQPGNEFPEVKAWRDQTGHPTLFTIEFKNHTAEVDDRLGQYMLDKGYAYAAKADLPVRLVQPSLQFQRDLAAGRA